MLLLNLTPAQAAAIAAGDVTTLSNVLRKGQELPSAMALFITDGNNNVVGFGSYPASSTFTPANTLSNVAALRAQASPTFLSGTVNLSGYYSAGDGAGGTYNFAPLDTTSVDNGGSVIVDSNSRRWYLERDPAQVNVKKFGALGNGVTNDSAAVTAAANYALSVGAYVYFPPGIYPMSLVMTGNLMPWFVGENGTTVVPLSASQPIFQLAGAGAFPTVQFRGITFGASGASPVGCGVWGGDVGFVFESCTWQGLKYGVVLNGCEWNKWWNCYMACTIGVFATTGYAGTGSDPLGFSVSTGTGNPSENYFYGCWLYPCDTSYYEDQGDNAYDQTSNVLFERCNLNRIAVVGSAGLGDVTLRKCWWEGSVTTTPSVRSFAISGSISGTILTVTATAGPILSGMTISGGGATTCTITGALGYGPNASTNTGLQGTGTYTVSVSQTSTLTNATCAKILPADIFYSEGPNWHISDMVGFNTQTAGMHFLAAQSSKVGPGGTGTTIMAPTAYGTVSNGSVPFISVEHSDISVGGISGIVTDPQAVMTFRNALVYNNGGVSFTGQNYYFENVEDVYPGGGQGVIFPMRTYPIALRAPGAGGLTNLWPGGTCTSALSTVYGSFTPAITSGDGFISNNGSLFNDGTTAPSYLHCPSVAANNGIMTPGTPFTLGNWIVLTFAIRQSSGSAQTFAIQGVAGSMLNSINNFYVPGDGAWRFLCALAPIIATTSTGDVAILNFSGAALSFDVSAIQLVAFPTMNKALQFIKSGLYVRPTVA